MANYITTDTELTGIADAIRTKGGTSEALTYPAGFVSAIEAIPSSGGAVEEKDVNFYDYDGTRLYSYTAAEFAELEAMPANPTHSGLTSQGWNWSLSEAKTHVEDYGFIEIGQMYITNDNKTRLYVNIPVDDYGIISVLTPILPILTYDDDTGEKQEGELAVTIDWGDGTIDTSVYDGSPESRDTYFAILRHTYVHAGNYVISINGSEPFTSMKSGTLDDMWLPNLNNYDEELSWLFTADPYYYLNIEDEESLDHIYDIWNKGRPCVTKIELGSNFIIMVNNAEFNCLFNLETITIPSITLTTLYTELTDNIYSWFCTENYFALFGYCGNLKNLVIPIVYNTDNEECYIEVSSGWEFNNNINLKHLIVTNKFRFNGNIGDSTSSIGVENILLQTFPDSGSTLDFNTDQNRAFFPFLNRLIIGDGWEAISSDPGLYLITSKLKEITIGPTVTNLGDGVFAQCSFLEHIYGMENVTSLGSNIIDGCDLLNEFVVPAGVSEILPFSIPYTLQKLVFMCPTQLTVPIKDDLEDYDCIMNVALQEIRFETREGLNSSDNLRGVEYRNFLTQFGATILCRSYENDIGKPSIPDAICYETFAEGETLPGSAGYGFVEWYSTISDRKRLENNIESGTGNEIYGYYWELY